VLNTPPPPGITLRSMQRVKSRQPGLTGCVLAGGPSLRFGSDKALHAVDGRPMISIVLEAVDAVCDETLVSTTGRRLPESLVGRREQVPDEPTRNSEAHGLGDPSAGPLAGILSCMRRAQNDWLLVVACDMPGVTASALERLHEAVAPGVDAVVASERDGRLHPLLGCYSVTALPVIEALLDSGRAAVHGLLDRLSTVKVVEFPERILTNANRPQDLM